MFFCSFPVQQTRYRIGSRVYLKKNQNASRPSEHPPVRGEKMSKRLGWIKGCKYKTSSWHLNGFPDGNNQNWLNSTINMMSGRSPPLLPDRLNYYVENNIYHTKYVVVVVVFKLKVVPISAQYFLTSVQVQLTRTPSLVTD